MIVEVEEEQDGRWIGEVPEIAGALAYGATPEEAAIRTAELARRILAERGE